MRHLHCQACEELRVLFCPKLAPCSSLRRQCGGLACWPCSPSVRQMRSGYASRLQRLLALPASISGYADSPGREVEHSRVRALPAALSVATPGGMGLQLLRRPSPLYMQPGRSVIQCHPELQRTAEAYSDRAMVWASAPGIFHAISEVAATPGADQNTCARLHVESARGGWGADEHR